MDYDDAEAQGATSEAEQVAALQKKIADLEKDNAKYREDRRKAAEEKFLSKYGEEIAAEVADLPEDKREAWAEKLLKLQSSAPTGSDEPAPEEPPKVETPPGLAAVVKEPAPGAPDGTTLTPDEFKRYVDAEGLNAAAAKYGHLVRFPDVDNPLATGQAAQVQGTYRPPS